MLFVKYCKEEFIVIVNKIVNVIVNVNNFILVNEIMEREIKCKFFFSGILFNDIEIGIILLVFFIILLCICFVSIVKTLYFMLRG